MNAPPLSLPVRRDDEPALARRLRSAVQGEVRFDRLSRTLYSTDASIYEITPLGAVLPKNVADIVAVVNECRTAGVSIVARGAGTGLAGGAVGPGVQLDLSRYMNRIGQVDLEARTVEVEPGVVLDELNARSDGPARKPRPRPASDDRHARRTALVYHCDNVGNIFRQHHPQRRDLVDTRVRGIERAGKTIEADLALDRRAQSSRKQRFI